MKTICLLLRTANMNQNETNRNELNRNHIGLCGVSNKHNKCYLRGKMGIVWQPSINIESLYKSQETLALIVRMLSDSTFHKYNVSCLGCYYNMDTFSDPVSA